jgi:hypothetical protein
MNRNHIAIILGGVGIGLVGPLTSDAIAFARAIEAGDIKILERFSAEYPGSVYSEKALQLAQTGCIVNFVNGACGGPPIKAGGGPYGG